MNDAHGHQHAPAAFGSNSSRYRGRLQLVLAITSAFTALEVTAGILTGSLVLLADAAHMLTDVAGLSLALLAIWFAQRPATQRRTFGYYRLEIMAAILNAVILFGVSAFILYEAYGRFMEPRQVDSLPLLAVATAGLVANLVGMRLLTEGSRASLNVRGAFLEMYSDLLGSAAAILAGVVLLTTGWRYADPLFAAGIALFILPRTWSLLRNALSVLLESAPTGVSMPELEGRLLSMSGVLGIHDLHVWTITSGFIAMSGHILVADGVDRDHLIVDARQLLHERFDIDHVTLQVETPRLEQELQQPCLPGTSPCYVMDEAGVNAGSAP